MALSMPPRQLPGGGPGMARRSSPARRLSPPRSPAYKDRDRDRDRERVRGSPKPTRSPYRDEPRGARSPALPSRLLESRAEIDKRRAENARKQQGDKEQRVVTRLDAAYAELDKVKRDLKTKVGERKQLQVQEHYREVEEEHVQKQHEKRLSELRRHEQKLDRELEHRERLEIRMRNRLKQLEEELDRLGGAPVPVAATDMDVADMQAVLAKEKQHTEELRTELQHLEHDAPELPPGRRGSPPRLLPEHRAYEHRAYGEPRYTVREVHEQAQPRPHHAYVAMPQAYPPAPGLPPRPVGRPMQPPPMYAPMQPVPSMQSMQGLPPSMSMAQLSVSSSTSQLTRPMDGLGGSPGLGFHVSTPFSYAGDPLGRAGPAFQGPVERPLVAPYGSAGLVRSSSTPVFTL